MHSGNSKANVNLKKLREEVLECPICGKKTLHIADYLYDIPHVGKVVISVGKCSNCGYTFRDIRAYEAKTPGKIVFHIESPRDTNVLVIRSSSASILIPELGVSMTPGPASEGFITTIEGVIERFLEALRAACSAPEADKDKCTEIENKLKAAKEGKLPFTLVVVDPEGASTIVSPKARREPVTREELAQLGYIVADREVEEQK